MKVCPAIEIVPVLDAPLFVVTQRYKEPGPDLLPVAAQGLLLPVSQLGAWLSQVHEHPAPVATSTGGLTRPPAVPTVIRLGAIEYEHPTPPWYTVIVLPATKMSPDRDADEVFAVTLKVTVPAPLPDCPLMIVIQGTLLAEFQSQPAPPVTETVPVPPSGRNVLLLTSVA